MKAMNFWKNQIKRQLIYRLRSGKHEVSGENLLFNLLSSNSSVLSIILALWTAIESTWMVVIQANTFPNNVNENGIYIRCHKSNKFSGHNWCYNNLLVVASKIFLSKMCCFLYHHHTRIYFARNFQIRWIEWALIKINDESSDKKKSPYIHHRDIKSYVFFFNFKHENYRIEIEMLFDKTWQINTMRESSSHMMWFVCACVRVCVCGARCFHCVKISF